MALREGKLFGEGLLDLDEVARCRDRAEEVRRSSIEQLAAVQKVTHQIDWGAAPAAQSSHSASTTGTFHCAHLLSAFSFDVAGPSKKTAWQNKHKAEKRKLHRRLGDAKMAKKRQENEVRGIKRGVEMRTEVDTARDLKHTGPAFKGKNMTPKEAQEMEKLEEFDYIPSIPG